LSVTSLSGQYFNPIMVIKSTVSVNDIRIFDGKINKLTSVIKLFPGHLWKACLEKKN
jgi:hypothetical protein